MYNKLSSIIKSTAKLINNNVNLLTLLIHTTFRATYIWWFFSFPQGCKYYNKKLLTILTIFAIMVL